MSTNGRFKLSTTESLYPPVEIEIDGKVYKTRRFSHPILIQVKALEDKALAGDIESLLKQIELILPISRKILDQFDIRELKDLTAHINKVVFGIEDVKEQKNVPKPGGKKSQKSKRSSQGSARTKNS